ncbi:MACPF domain-containing protein [Acorus calamus]|uniref:MACPF domain-containing protein n=1 Tax=Acorus calamus TaxID=4465 RepID=A0AAV9CHW7_ACOCL|nr:MACPF domain-containing protein [Acorus calamus]
MAKIVVEKALECLGKGFDATSDFRLKFCKGKERLVKLNEAEKRELVIRGFGAFEGVSVDIKCNKGDRIRYQSDVLEFNLMSELFNQKSSLGGKIPSGLFNSMFGFNGSTWAKDAAETKRLAMDGYFISLFDLHIDRSPLALSDEVVKAVPSVWDPEALARFIAKYGTHVVVGVSMGGQDVVLVRQDQSSNLQPWELKKNLDRLGDQLFTGTCTLPSSHFKSKDNNNNNSKKHKIPEAFNVYDPQPTLLNSFSPVSNKDGITVMCSKRGGDTSADSHCEWLLTVPSMPDAINFCFIPITSLLKGVPGKGFLSHAINLYLRYKPPITDLKYFLEFQTHKIWAPVHSDLPLGPPTNKAIPTPPLQFNLLGPKLYINTAQVTVNRRPVTGMRLYLEGNKCNRLAVHLQHLSMGPSRLGFQTDGPTFWQGSDAAADGDRFLEPIQWKIFSHVCTAPVDPNWAEPNRESAFIVTGAQLDVKAHDTKSALHLRLQFSELPGCTVGQSVWEQGPSGFSQKSGIFSTLSTTFSGSAGTEKQKPVIIVDSGVYPTGPPVPAQAQKLLRIIDTGDICKGPQDSPGHWLVTGAKLDIEKGKVCLHVKFSLLNWVED